LLEQSYQGDAADLTFYRPNLAGLVKSFAAFNPHARFRVSGKEVAPTTSLWRKWLPAMKPPPHWYDLDRLRGLVAGRLAASRRDGTRPQTLRDFIAGNFCGLSGTVVRSLLLDQCGLDGRTLEDLARGDDLDDGRLARLLEGMKKHARAV